jgi:hypothetical protein
MLHESLQGEWTQERLNQVVGFTRDDVARQICAVLNLLQKAPPERIVSIAIAGGAVQFGDGSQLVLDGTKGSEFLTNYVRERETWIVVMEYNREGDPRVTGELDRLLRQEKKLDQFQSKLLGGLLKRTTDRDGSWVAIHEGVFNELTNRE